MKLITLNAWGGVVHKPLLEFIKNYYIKTDIFCLQEVFSGEKSARSYLGKVQLNLFSDIQKILTDFDGYHASAQEGDVGGLAIFIKKSFGVKNVNHVIVSREPNTTMDENDESYFSMGRDLQLMEFKHLGKTYTVINFHGMWVAKGKGDTHKRIEQSEKLKKIFDESKGARILCGDLNQNADTKSMAILSEGNRNLIQEYKIDSTRSSLYTKSASKSADYIIVSQEVEVKDFSALQEEVSDHLPLYLEFE
jgi:endonuclease/exonuclease/phosphatase family metal-dependent hydrolase